MKRSVYAFSSLALACLVSTAWATLSSESFSAWMPSLSVQRTAAAEPTVWTGTTQQVTFESASDVKTFSYESTSESNELIYFVCQDASAGALTMSGEDSFGETFLTFDAKGMYGYMQLPGFTKMTLTLKPGATQTFPFTVTVDLLKYTGFMPMGKFYDQPIMLTDGTSDLAFPYAYSFYTGDPTEIKSWSYATFVGFDAEQAGVASLNVPVGDIYVYDYNIQTSAYSNPRLVSLKEGSTQEHQITVEAGKSYIAALPNSKPMYATVYLPNQLVKGDNSVTLQSTADQKNFTYTCQQENGEMLYLQNKNTGDRTGYEVRFTGAVREGAELPYEYYDLGAGGFSAIKLNQGDVLDFTVTTDLNTDNVAFPRTFKVEALGFNLIQNPMTMMYDLPGSDYEIPITLSATAQVIPTCENTSTWVPLLSGKSNVTWGRFQATENGIMNVSIEDYMIYVFEDNNDNPINGKSIAIPNGSNSKTDHRFLVEAGKDYRIAFVNQRPLAVSIATAVITDGEDCLQPIDQTKGSISVVKDKVMWYRYTPAEEDSYLILASDGKFDGVAQLYEDCEDAAPKGFTTTAGTAGEYRTLVTPGHSYLIKVSATATTQEGATLTVTGRAPIAGESCQTATTALIGTTAIGTEVRTYWYKHTVQKACLLHLEGPAQAALSLHGDCNGTVVGTGVVDGGKMAYDYKMAAGDEVWILWTPTSSLTEASFTLAENEIPETFYCDYPGHFNLGEDIVMTNRTNETWYEFTVDKDGFADFAVTEMAWIEASWSTSLRTACNGKLIPYLTKEMVNGAVHYKFPIEAGQKYLYYVYQYATSTGADITVKSSYLAPKAGETCAAPIQLTLGAEQPITEKVLSEWYSLVAPQSGFYTVDAIVGEGYANRVSVYTDGCGSSYVAQGNGQYGGVTSIKQLTIYAEAGTTILLNAVSVDGFNTTGQMVKLAFSREAVDGDVCAKAIQAELSTPYVYAKDKVVWYKYTIGAGESLQMLTDKSAVRPAVYTECGGSNMLYTLFTSTSEKNADNVLVYRMTLKATPDAPQTIYLSLPINTMGTTLTLSTPTSVSNLNLKPMMIYPNPNNGRFYVSLDEVKENAAVSVFDMNGQRVFVQSLNSNLTAMDLSQLASGSYIVAVRNGEKSITERMIIK